MENLCFCKQILLKKFISSAREQAIENCPHPNLEQLRFTALCPDAITGFEHFLCPVPPNMCLSVRNIKKNICCQDVKASLVLSVLSQSRER